MLRRRIITQPDGSRPGAGRGPCRLGISAWARAAREHGWPRLRAGEQVHFESYDADWKAINRGSYRKKRVELTGYWFLPEQKTAGLLPLVVLMHGSDGLSDHQIRYARVLNSKGIAALPGR